MPSVITWLLGCLLLAAESVLLGTFAVDGWSLQIGVVLAIFLGLKREFVAGALTLAALLPVVEWLVVGPMGFYSLGLVVVFFLMRPLRTNIQKGWGLAHMMLAAVMSLVHGGVMSLAVLLSRPDSPVLGSLLWNIGPAALVTGIATVGLGRLLDRGDRMLNPRSGRTVLELS